MNSPDFISFYSAVKGQTSGGPLFHSFAHLFPNTTNVTSELAPCSLRHILHNPTNRQIWQTKKPDFCILPVFGINSDTPIIR